MRESVVLALLAAGIGCAGGSDADELRRAREAAATGVEAADRYCTLRDSLLAAPLAPTTRDAVLEQVLSAPEPLDDWCAHRAGEEGAH